MDMDMDMPHMPCSMNSAFTWSYQGTCIIISQWKLNSILSLTVTCLLIMLFVIFIQWVHFRLNILNKEQLLLQAKSSARYQNLKRLRILLYALESFSSLIVMLLFMTYVGWIWLAITLGSMAGWYIYDTTATIPDILDRDPLICH